VRLVVLRLQTMVIFEQIRRSLLGHRVDERRAAAQREGVSVTRQFRLFRFTV
jgi:hypothetical protein